MGYKGGVYESIYKYGGGYNALQVIGELEKKERYYHLAINDDGNYEWKRKKSESEKFNFADIPHNKITSLNGLNILVPFYTKTNLLILLLMLYRLMSMIVWWS
ncbi:hypothetical protein [Campylobacter lanienae]|uniref:hypothetical protein n=1 Tax=Campylobacter lanienae TaxID=75658 RepID=UPI00164D70CE|nr:hypothetical protein [Campylobacter lanienae]